MKFSKSELNIIYQYAAPTKAETIAGMKEIVPVMKDLLTKAKFLAERDNSIRQRFAAAKAQEPIMHGHDLSGIEQFHPETRHMIMLEVQKQRFVGFKGGGASCGQRMISVDFQSASIITGEAALPLRWLCQIPLCGLAD